jgi:choline kinase
MIMVEAVATRHGTMIAIILAAGIGSRMRPLTETIPKPLITVDGQPLIDRTLSLLHTAGIRDVIIVGGYHFGKLRDHCMHWDDRLNITTIENSNYLKGNIISLLSARDHLSGNILLMNADHIYSQALMDSFLTICFAQNTLSNGSPSIIIACDSGRTLTDDDMKVKFGETEQDLEKEIGHDSEEDTENDSEQDIGKDSELEIGHDIEKHIGKDSELETEQDIDQEVGHDSEQDMNQEIGQILGPDSPWRHERIMGKLTAIGKSLEDSGRGYIGMTFIHGEAVDEYRAALDATIEFCGEGAVVEDVLGYLAWNKQKVIGIDLSGMGWMEIDTPWDRKQANACLSRGDWEGFWNVDRG